MKLLRLAAENESAVAVYRDRLHALEARFGCEMLVSASIVKDFPQDGQESRGWFIRPEREDLVCVYTDHNWSPGVGPRLSLREAVEAMEQSVMTCSRIEVGKPGLRGAA